VGPSTALGEVFASDYAEIRLPIPPSQLPFVKLPTDENDTPIPVILSDASGVAEPDQWSAKIVRTEGTLDETTRELFVIARIDDPFARTGKSAPLRIGQPLRATIQGIVLENSYVLPRSALRGVNRVYMVMNEPPVLMRRDLSPIWSTSNEVVAREGFTDGEKLASSSLTYAVDGAKVQIVEPSTETVTEEVISPAAPKS
jgi:hypothetical protein